MSDDRELLAHYLAIRAESVKATEQELQRDFGDGLYPAWAKASLVHRRPT